MPNLNTNQMSPAGANETTLGNVTAENAFPTVTGGSIRLVLIMDPALGISGLREGTALAALTKHDGRLFRVRVCCRVTTGTGSTFTLKLYQWNGVNTNLTTFTNDTAIASFTSGSISTTTAVVVLQADLTWDKTSQRLVGSFDVIEDVNYTARAATTAATGLSKASTVHQYFVTATFGSGNASNAVVLTEFSIDQV